MNKVKEVWTKSPITEKNMVLHYNLYSPEGYDALYPQKYGKLLFAQETNGKLTDQILRTDANIKQASERKSMLDNVYRKRLLSLLGVKYIIESKVGDGKNLRTTEERFPEENFILEWEDSKFRIWEFKDALPRAFLVHDYKVAKTDQEIADLLFNESTDLSKTTILEDKPNYSNLTIEQLNNETIINDVKITNYAPNDIKIEVQTNRPGLLFLSDNYYPGWNAYINDKKTKIYRANYSFRAVEIDAGESEIKFSYEPLSFKIGAITSIATLFIISIYKIFTKFFYKS